MKRMKTIISYLREQAREHRSDIYFFVGFVFVVLILTLPTNILYRDSSLLVLKTIDEEAFQTVLFQMHRGLQNLDISSITVGAFLSYGWTYFFANAILTYPFYLAGNEALVIILPRVFSALAGAVTIFMVFKIADYTLPRRQALLIALFLLLLPSFYRNAFWMHPDHPVIAALAISLYFFIKDQFRFGKHFTIALVALGFALSMKLTAILFFVIVALYVLCGALLFHKSLKRFIQHGLLVCVVPVIALIAFNPTVLLPGRTHAIIEALRATEIDNRTNHGNAINDITIMSISQDVIATHFVPLALFVVCILLFGVGIIIEVRRRTKYAVALIAGSWFLFFLIYNVMRVEKLWEHYYLPVFMFAPLSFVSLHYFPKLQKYTTRILVGILLFQAFVMAPHISTIFAIQRSPSVNRDYGADIDVEHVRQVSAHAVGILQRGGLTPKTVLVSPYLPFPKREYGFDYNTLRRIYGPLSEGQIRGYGFPEVIILDKNENYFKDPADPALQNLTSYPAIIESQGYVQKLIAGYDISFEASSYRYRVIANDELVVIFQRIRP